MNHTYPHIIKQQVIELRGLRQADARDLQERIKNHFYRVLLPLIEQQLDLLAPGADLIQLERLELDLGRIDIDHFEQALTTALDRQMEQQIHQLKLSRITSEETSPKGSSHSDKEWELFYHFVETGNLPWWADQKEDKILQDTLSYLCKNQVTRLIPQLQRWLSQEATARRIVRQFSSDALTQLLHVQLGTNLPNLEPSITALFTQSIPIAQKLGIAEHHYREEAWLQLLQITYNQDSVSFNEIVFWHEYFLQLSSALRLKYTSLLAVIYRVMDWRKFPELFAIIKKLEADSQTKASKREGLSVPIRLTPKVKQLLCQGIYQGEVTTLIRQLDIHPTLRQAVTQLWMNHLAKYLSKAEMKPALRQKIKSCYKQLAKSDWDYAEVVSVLQQTAQTYPSASTVASSDSFSKADELFIENAGLVILWPYLQRFFTSLGLIDKGRFKEEAAAHRAAGLLHFLAEGPSNMPEYRMTLNKVLCGLPWDSVLSFGEGLTNLEKEECTVLLQSVIANAPVLQNMTVDGFRGSFLLRKGMLRPRPDIWELHVEQETYDVVLERFPWSWQVVKLPWLDKMIQVEW